MPEPSASLSWLAQREAEVHLRCCSFESRSAADLALKHGGDTTLLDLRRRARCSGCGKTPAQVGPEAEISCSAWRSFYRQSDKLKGLAGRPD